MSRLDDLANTAPLQPPVSTGSVAPSPDPGPPFSPPPNRHNAFTQVTITQLYFFIWKWLAASILFALPFFILNLLIVMFSR